MRCAPLQSTVAKVHFVSKKKVATEGMPEVFARFFEPHQLEEEYGGTLSRYNICAAAYIISAS